MISASDLVDSAFDFLKVACLDLLPPPLATTAWAASPPAQLQRHSNCLGCSSMLSRMINLPSRGIYVSTIEGQPSSAIEAGHLEPLLHTYLIGSTIHSPKLHLKDYTKFKLALIYYC